MCKQNDKTQSVPGNFGLTLKLHKTRRYPVHITCQYDHFLMTHCFLALNNIPLSGYTLVYPFTSEGHLDSFPILAIMNKAAINIHVQIFCGNKFSTTVGEYQGRQLLDRMVRGYLLV